MQKDQELCGCTPGKPLYELKLLVAALERQEQERKAKENQQTLDAASRWVLDEKRAG